MSWSCGSFMENNVFPVLKSIVFTPVVILFSPDTDRETCALCMSWYLVPVWYQCLLIKLYASLCKDTGSILLCVRQPLWHSLLSFVKQKGIKKGPHKCIELFFIYTIINCTPAPGWITCIITMNTWNDEGTCIWQGIVQHVNHTLLSHFYLFTFIQFQFH